MTADDDRLRSRRRYRAGCTHDRGDQRDGDEDADRPPQSPTPRSLHRTRPPQVRARAETCGCTSSRSLSAVNARVSVTRITRHRTYNIRPRRRKGESESSDSRLCRGGRLPPGDRLGFAIHDNPRPAATEAACSGRGSWCKDRLPSRAGSTGSGTRGGRPGSEDCRS